MAACARALWASGVAFHGANGARDGRLRGSRRRLSDERLDRARSPAGRMEASCRGQPVRDDPDQSPVVADRARADRPVARPRALDPRRIRHGAVRLAHGEPMDERPAAGRACDAGLDRASRRPARRAARTPRARPAGSTGTDGVLSRGRPLLRCATLHDHPVAAPVRTTDAGCTEAVASDPRRPFRGRHLNLCGDDGKQRPLRRGAL